MSYVHREWIAMPSTNTVVTIDEYGQVEHVIARSVSMSDINKIAASNEMYEALKSLIEWLGNDSQFEQANKAIKALAKADGK